jgi:putative ABC transport system ATP-binding protein
MSVVSIKNLTKMFGSGHTAVTAVDNISLDVEPGDIVLVTGPSGSGKTTLISMIGTLMQPTSGQILIDGQDVSKLNNKAVSRLRLKSIGFMFQAFNLLSALTAEQNVTAPMLANGTSKQQAASRAKELLEKLHLGQRLGNLPRNLSGGEQQRVAIARALGNSPKLILADEPTANLDSKTGHEVMILLCEIACRENRAVIIVSHDQRLKAAAKRVITIEDGRLVREEPGDHNLHCRMHKK